MSSQACKFAKGDVITCTRDSSGGGFSKGKTYVVKDVLISSWDRMTWTVMTELDDYGSTTNGWAEKFFDFGSHEYSPSQEGDRDDDL